MKTIMLHIMDENLTEREFRRLIDIVAALRGPGGCPWDREQTAQSLTPYILEEASELVEAIEAKSRAEVVEELGDFLFQVVLQCQIAQDNGQFQMKDVLETLNTKMIHRHPHVFGNSKDKAINSADVVKQWEKIKMAEKANILDSSASKPNPIQIPSTLPALSAAHKVGAKSGGWGFDWNQEKESWRSVLLKVEEELAELKEALESGPSSHVESELGDLHFALAQLSRHLGLQSETALRKCNRRFLKRFALMIELSGMQKETFAALPAEKKEEFWNKAKAQLGGME